MRLELAAGDRPTPGFVHQDMRDLPDIDIRCRLEDIKDHVEPGSCSELRATHILEHFSHTETVAVLETWRSLLANGGRLYLEVPNLEWQARALIEGHPDFDQAGIVELIFGYQNYEGNSHYTGFTLQTLSQSLISAGFDQSRLTDIGMVICAEAFNFRTS